MDGGVDASSPDAGDFDAGSGDAGQADAGADDDAGASEDAGGPPPTLGEEHEAGVFAFDTRAFGEVISAQATPPRVVGLGELNHHNLEMMEVMGDIKIDLIENHGARLLIWEDWWGQIAPINEHLDNCEEDVLREVFRTYFVRRRHESSFRVVQYVCEWNQAQPDDTVFLAGMDGKSLYYSTHPMRQFAIDHMTLIQERIDELNADPDRAADVEFSPDDFYRCTNSGQGTTADEWFALQGEDGWQEGYTLETHLACINAVELTEYAFSALPEEELSEMQRHAANIRQIELEYAYAYGLIEGGTFLDRRDARVDGMATISQTLIRDLREGAIAVVDASIFHTIENSEAVSGGLTEPYEYGFRNGGRRLAAQYGDAYISVIVSASQFVFLGRDEVFEIDIRGEGNVDVELQVEYGGTIIIDTDEATGMGLAFGPSVDVRAFVLDTIPSQQADYIITLPESVVEEVLPRFVPED